jgi:hypothetical protein
LLHDSPNNHGTLRIRKKERDKKESTKIFDIQLDAPYIVRWKGMTLSKYKKLLNKWYNKEEERTLFMESIKYSMETWEDLDKLRTNSLKIWQDFDKIKKMVYEEQAQQAFGGGEESLLESGDW